MKNIFILFTVLLITSCGSSNEKETESTVIAEKNSIILTDDQLKPVTISLGNVEQKVISKTIKVNGKIDVPPQNLVSVSIPLGGYLRSTKLLPGMHLSKGETIAVLEDQQYIQIQQDYLTTKAKFEMAEAEYFRQKELNENKASSDKMVQQTKTEYTTQKIILKALAEKLKLININPQVLTADNISKDISIYAPFDGYVSKVNVNIGKYVTPSDVLFELVNPKDIHLNLQVFEKDLIQLSVGQKLIAYTNSNPGNKHACEIILISKDIGADRTAEVHCHFEDYDKNLLPGMYMNADIEINNNKVYAVPEEAIVAFEGKSYLFILNGKNKFTMLAIEPGEHENDWSEVKNYRDFLEKQIVVKNAYTLLMAAKNKQEE
jgi:cobalt-zinc-cadmium efflux system membrane fusion protein